MSTNYPGSLDTTSVLKNNSVDATPTETTHEVLHNNTSDAIIAVETELGINPSGSYIDVVTRLADTLVKTPGVAQVILPSADVVGLTLKNSSGSFTSNFLEIRNNLNNTLAFIDHTGVLSAQGLQIAGVPLSSANLSDVASIAFLAGPAFTGNPTATTQTAGNNSTRLATTAFVTAAIAAASPAVASVFGRTGAVVATSGDYTDAQVTNSPTNILTTTGDILYASAANTLHRLAIGTTGQTLTIVSGLPAWVSPYIGFDQTTSPVSITSTTEATGTAVVTGTAHTYNGNPVVIEFTSPNLSISNVSQTVTFNLFEGSTNLGQLSVFTSGGVPPGSGGGVGTTYFNPSGSLVITPSAGSHTYKVTAFSSLSSGASVLAGAGGAGTAVPALLTYTYI